MPVIKVEYVRHSIPVSDPTDLPGMLKHISGLHQLVAVNVADSEGEEPLLFTPENVRILLNRKPEKLYLEAIPIGNFRKLAGQRVGQAIQATLTLRELLRERYVVALAGEIGNYLSEAQQVLMMIECFVQQKNHPAITEHLAELQAYISQLTADCRESGDNVRCMDQLQYQILPSLQKMRKNFGK